VKAGRSIPALGGAPGIWKTRDPAGMFARGWRILVSVRAGVAAGRGPRHRSGARENRSYSGRSSAAIRAEGRTLGISAAVRVGPHAQTGATRRSRRDAPRAGTRLIPILIAVVLPRQNSSRSCEPNTPARRR
jgi:hypothetical protein